MKMHPKTSTNNPGTILYTAESLADLANAFDKMAATARERAAAERTNKGQREGEAAAFTHVAQMLRDTKLVTPEQEAAQNEILNGKRWLRVLTTSGGSPSKPRDLINPDDKGCPIDPHASVAIFVHGKRVNIRGDGIIIVSDDK